MSRIERVAGAEHEGSTLVDVLVRLIDGCSAAEARALVHGGAVFVSGKRARDVGQRVAAGARLVIHRTESAAPPALAPLVVLYEDADLIVLDKAPGDHLNETETSARPALVERIPGAFVVHRLDRETSGVVAMAKSAAVAERLSAAFRERRVGKSYLAVVEGSPADAELTDPIGLDKRRPRARRVRADGQRAHTTLTVLGRRGALALVEAVPHTGRTHQIRVHVAHHGWPIVGDRLYGGPMVVRLDDVVLEVPRTLLHARRLELPGWPPFEAPVPEDLARFAGPMLGSVAGSC